MQLRDIQIPQLVLNCVMSLSRYAGRKTALSLRSTRTPLRLFATLKSATVAHSESNLANLTLAPRLPPLPTAPQSVPDDDESVIVDADIPQTVIVSTSQNVTRGKFEFSSLGELPAPTAPGYIDAMKLRLDVCKYICDFASNSANQQLARRTKSAALKDLDWVMSRRKDAVALPPEIQSEFVVMFKENVFRQSPFVNVKVVSMTDVAVVDPAWEHLEYVYKILMNFMRWFPESPELTLRVAKKAVQLMNLPDANERAGLAAFIKMYLSLRPDCHGKDIFCRRRASRVECRESQGTGEGFYGFPEIPAFRYGGPVPHGRYLGFLV